MRHPNEKCYVCTSLATGSVFGMAVCAPCKKFVWRHRFSNLNSLRCEVGFGPQRNNCDLTRKRSCTKCRLRRSIEGNRRLRQFLEKNLPNQTTGAKPEQPVNRGHLVAMDKLRGFLATKKHDSITSSNDTNSNDSSPSFIVTSSSNNNTDNHVPVISTSVCLTPVSDSETSTTTAAVHFSSSAAASPFTFGANNNNNNSNTQLIDNYNSPDTNNDNNKIYSYLMWALGFIQPTYSTFTKRFFENCRNCSADDYCQLLLISAKNNGASFSEALFAALNIDNNEQQSSTSGTAPLKDVLSAFSLYFSLVASEEIPVKTLLDAVRNNSCFAQLANIPMQMVITNFIHQRYDPLLMAR